MNETTVRDLYAMLAVAIEQGKGQQIVFADHLPEGIDLYVGEDEDPIATIDHL
jgi:hypothetical protein